MEPSLAESNQERVRNLAAQGVLFDPLQMLKLRLDMLTDFVFGDGPVSCWDRDLFEARWEEQISEICDQAEQGLTRRLLLEGV